jgi:hydroxymethylglutaryl-CoA reductase (NADPH)
LRSNEWVTVPETEYDVLARQATDVSVIDLQQLSMSFDARTAKKAGTALPSSFARVDPFIQIAESPRLSSQVANSLENITYFLTHHFPTSSGKFFTNICHSVRNVQDEETCFISTSSEIPKSETLMLSFTAEGREDFISALTKQGTFLSDAFGPIKYTVENPEQEAIAEMKSGKWVVYAARTLVVRFWDLTKVSMVLPGFCRQNLTAPTFARKQTIWIFYSFLLDMY